MLHLDISIPGLSRLVRGSQCISPLHVLELPPPPFVSSPMFDLNPGTLQLRNTSHGVLRPRMGRTRVVACRFTHRRAVEEHWPGKQGSVCGMHSSLEV